MPPSLEFMGFLRCCKGLSTWDKSEKLGVKYSEAPSYWTLSRPAWLLSWDNLLDPVAGQLAQFLGVAGCEGYDWVKGGQ